MNKKYLKNYTLDQLDQFVNELGWEKFRGKQIFEWMYRKKVDSLTEMTNLPKGLREELDNKALLYTLEVDTENVRVSLDGTMKFLSRLKEGNIGIETAVMNYNYGNTVCISSQAGCDMNCSFCASTVTGKDRDLTSGEMIDQVIMAEKLLPEHEKISNIVVMGSGEPLLNYDNLIKFIRLVNNGKGINIGTRNITISTCGVVPGIKKLAQEKLQLSLAISLHAPEDKVRNELVPLNKKYSINELMNACQDYYQKTKRRITFEYVLIKGVNDSERDAEHLSSLLSEQNMPLHVNLIPFNYVEESNYAPPSVRKVNDFRRVLENESINVTVRKEKGTDIEGACGQLRSGIMRQ